MKPKNNLVKRKRTSEDDFYSHTSEDAIEDDYELLIKEVLRLRERDTQRDQLIKKKDKQLLKQKRLLEEKDHEIQNLKSTANALANWNRKRVNGLLYLRDLASR